MFFRKKPKQIEISGRLGVNINDLTSIRLHLNPNLEKRMEDVLDKTLRGNDIIGVEAISCKGGNRQSDEVTAIITIRNDDYSTVRCPRFRNEIMYKPGENESVRKMEGNYCYCGESLIKLIGIKGIEEWQKKIFDCPYAKFK